MYSLNIVDSVAWVGGSLVLSCVTDQTLLLSESNVRWSNAVSLVVDEDLNLPVLHNTDARVGGPQINTDNCCGQLSAKLRQALLGRRDGGRTSAIAFL